MNRIPLEPDKYYHIFNHAVGRENLFVLEKNYSYFLEKYSKYIPPIADTFAYCLMPNHYHILIRIKPENELLAFFNHKIQSKEPLAIYDELTRKRIPQVFSNFFNAYAKAINKQESRQGSLFKESFGRKHIDTPEYLKDAIHYIHYNPVHHKFVDDFTNWKYSSYHSIVSALPTQIMRREVIDLFDDVDNFVYFHTKNISSDLFDDTE